MFNVGDQVTYLPEMKGYRARATVLRVHEDGTYTIRTTHLIDRLTLKCDKLETAQRFRYHGAILKRHVQR